jgi:hypothetical protein
MLELQNLLIRDFGGCGGLLVELEEGRGRDAGTDAGAEVPDVDAYLLKIEENVNCVHFVSATADVSVASVCSHQP